MLHIYGLPCNQNDLKMASNDLKGQNFSCKFLLSQSIVIVDQDGVFFCGQQNGFVVATVVFVDDWFYCGKCCFCGRLVSLWQVLLLWKIGFIVASFVIMDDWFCCGKCCYSGSAQPASNPVVALTELDSAPATKCQTWIPWNIRLGL